MLQRRGRGGFLGRFPTRDAATQRAEELAAGHVIAQVVVLDGTGRVLLDKPRINVKHRQTAQQILDERMRPFQDGKFAESLLASERDWSLHEEIEINGEPLRLNIFLHEGSMFDEIHVFGSIDDTDLPDLATYQDTLIPWAPREPLKK